MPIFAYRSVRRMLDELAPCLSADRIRELEGNLRSQNAQTVPAEWEIAVGYALSKVGKIIDPGIHRSGNPDFIFVPRGGSQQIIVEVTALSDKSADDENPVQRFTNRLLDVAARAGISSDIGGLDWNFGAVEIDGKVIIGIPARGDIDAFFNEKRFRAFLLRIKASPFESHTFEFAARGAVSAITFIPGQRQTSGRYRSYKIATRLDDRGVFNRLKNKEGQLSVSGLNLPSVVFLCDNDSHLLQYQQLNSPGTFKVREIISAFLSGRPGLKLGELVLDQNLPRLGKRIDAVITLTVHQPSGIFELGSQRVFRGEFIPASHCNERVHSNEFIQIMNDAIAQLPVPVSTALNAMTPYKWPANYGRGEWSGMKVKISLLTLQKVLAGEISYDDFVRDHGDLAGHITRLNDSGHMITGIEISEEKDRDDDWVTLKFDGLQPSRWFGKSKPKGK